MYIYIYIFMIKVEPILEVLVGKTLEQALIEVMEEEELEMLRKHQVNIGEIPLYILNIKIFIKFIYINFYINHIFVNYIYIFNTL